MKYSQKKERNGLETGHHQPPRLSFSDKRQSGLCFPDTFQGFATKSIFEVIRGLGRACVEVSESLFVSFLLHDCGAAVKREVF